MKKGMLYSILLYLIGFGVAGIVALTVKQTYIHGPGLHHMIMLLTIFIGLIWMVFSTIKMFIKPTEKLKGVIVVNALVFAVFMLAFLIIR